VLVRGGRFESAAGGGLDGTGDNACNEDRGSKAGRDCAKIFH
jgi:hypothetical protein